uniref:Sus2 n=1 Tax=Arundo donax TaxID=35708 RepID=A0A0A9EHU3_ARUDO
METLWHHCYRTRWELPSAILLMLWKRLNIQILTYTGRSLTRSTISLANSLLI